MSCVIVELFVGLTFNTRTFIIKELLNNPKMINFPLQDTADIFNYQNLISAFRVIFINRLIGDVSKMFWDQVLIILRALKTFYEGKSNCLWPFYYYLPSFSWGGGGFIQAGYLLWYSTKYNIINELIRLKFRNNDDIKGTTF